MAWLNRLFGRRETKALDLPIVYEWQSGQVVYPEITFDRLKKDGYKTNAAVGACVAAYLFAYPEPRPVAKDKNGDPLPKTHALQQLLDRPNPLMSHGELMRYVAAYKSIGGNCYLHKQRNANGLTIQLWPYHDGQIQPVVGRTAWLAGYQYDLGDGNKRPIPLADIMHLKWPVVDPDRPWMALSPLVQIAREVDTDGELTRMLWALTKNDGVPRTVLMFGENKILTQQEVELMRQTFKAQHGGDNRGGVGFLTGGATLQRLALNLNELDLTALRNVPEARIAAAFRIPAIVAGLTAGLERSTYSNFAEARQLFAQDTLVPLWKADADEWTADLAAEFGDGITIEYDTKDVAALQEDATALYTRVLNAYDKGVMMKNEAREKLGLPPVGDVKRSDPEGDLFKGEQYLPGQEPRQPTILDVTPQPGQPPQLTDGQPPQQPQMAQQPAQQVQA